MDGVWRATWSRRVVRLRSVAVAAVVGLCGCDGAGLTIDDLAPPEAWPKAELPEAALRRLTHAQYDHVLHDLFGPQLTVPTLAEPDLAVGGLHSVGASAGSFSPRGAESAEEAAFAMAAQIVADPTLRERLPRCEPSDDACLRLTITRVGRHLYRRALTEVEVDRVLSVAVAARQALGDDAGLEFALATMLQSPHFLYREELGDGSGDVRTLSAMELASRLAFLLWDSGPDTLLYLAAERGDLDTREGLFAQAARMLDDPRARRGIRAYFSDQFELDALDEMTKDPIVFDRYAPDLGPSAREETLSLLEYMALDADADFRDVMVTRETFINPYLASLYGVPAPSPDGFARVELPESAHRRGLLGHASFLSLQAHNVSSSATRRGMSVRTTFLCQAIPAPPVNVDTSIPEPSGMTPTLRDRVAEHLEEPSCAGCHRLMDPIGLGLENYDGIGHWRDNDNGAPIDASGEIDGVRFAGPAELAQAIRDHRNFPDCTVRTLTRYATGRVEPDGAEAALDLLTERFTGAHDHRFRPLLMELIVSPLFRQVGAPEVSE